jgi:hypothetical protein
MKYRKLRFAFSAVCGIICLLLIALWIASLWLDKCITLISFGEQFHIAINGFWSGRLALFNDPDGPYQGSIIGLGGEQIDTIGFGDTLGIYYRHFRWPSGAVLWTLQLSIWHPVASTVLVAGFPWILRSRRFSLRTLLIAMALVAVALGVLIYAAN